MEVEGRRDGDDEVPVARRFPSVTLNKKIGFRRAWNKKDKWVEVLGHAATGGFVSHCGWNSILEGLWHGVPIVTWPIYAEEQLNAFVMLKELGLADELRLDHKGRGVGGNLVQAEEIERAVGRLMGGGAASMRKRVKEMREAARNAVKEGGSSYDSIGKLIQDFIKSIE
ncbi:UDP-glycosyltransferase 71K2-like [Syzygium oleosum]|uniref:UDP-glycosyltransferase 71K2-like n=1 Tax=Syzygium oleosum TaxID=219896 RepID=UPI0024BB8BF9|nr:UDP-glycosyltransferase 71K2-like [Syzygium oleosum]